MASSGRQAEIAVEAHHFGDHVTNFCEQLATDVFDFVGAQAANFFDHRQRQRETCRAAAHKQCRRNDQRQRHFQRKRCARSSGALDVPRSSLRLGIPVPLLGAGNDRPNHPDCRRSADQRPVAQTQARARGPTGGSRLQRVEALELVSKSKPDLILLDVMMPDMDGIEVCRRLQDSFGNARRFPSFLSPRARQRRVKLKVSVWAPSTTSPSRSTSTKPWPVCRRSFGSVTVNREQVVDLSAGWSTPADPPRFGVVTQGIAHNLNNLLGVVIGYLDLVKAYYDRPDQVKKNSQQSKTRLPALSQSSSSSACSSSNLRPPFIKGNVQRLLRAASRGFMRTTG